MFTRKSRIVTLLIHLTWCLQNIKSVPENHMGVYRVGVYQIQPFGKMVLFCGGDHGAPMNEVKELKNEVKELRLRIF